MTGRAVVRERESAVVAVVDGINEGRQETGTPVRIPR